MELVISTDGVARMVYQEEMNIAELGQISIQRASHVEPDEAGNWSADLSPVDGPILGPFTLRKEAVRAETDWIISRLARTLTVISI